ncbi:MAG: hypothetical protein M3R08_09560 [Bacteroidota bacterium]|nr:hypothetical protein [Bacteroidota bacterium]
MKKFILLFLIVAPIAASAGKMHVVVFTRDRMVVEYRCENRVSRSNGTGISRTIQQTPASITWHGVGGVPPYTLIEQDIDRFRNVCITIMDATGTMATGCSILGEQRHLVPIECPPLNDQEQADQQVFSLVKDSLCLADPFNCWLQQVNEEGNVITERPVLKSDPRTHVNSGSKDAKERKIRTAVPVRDRPIRDREVHHRVISHERPVREGPSRESSTSYSNGRSSSRSNEGANGGGGSNGFPYSNSSAR